MNENSASPECAAREWLRFAASDLACARLALNEENVLPSQLGFHAQQAAEKAIKAALVHASVPFPKTHDLDELITLWRGAGRHWPAALDAISEMTVFAFRARYPGDIDPPTRNEAATALRLAEQIFEWAQGIIPGSQTITSARSGERLQNLISKSATLLEALPYIQRFSGATFVIKYGGSFMDSPDPAVRNGVARDLVFLESVEINPVVVHGGGKAITRAMEKTGLKANFIQGQRVTDEPTVEVVEQVLSREINPEIVKAINELGGAARGFSGTEIFTCRKLWLTGSSGEKIDVGYVGEVTRVNTAPLLECIERGITPIISPTARGEDGRAYNCNADVAAAQAAIALQARRLVFMSDVPGLMRDPKDPSTLIPHISTSEVAALKESGVIDQGMIPKMDSAVAAIKSGVEKVSLVDGRVPHSVLLEIFTDAGVGTELVR